MTPNACSYVLIILLALSKSCIYYQKITENKNKNCVKCIVVCVCGVVICVIVRLVSMSNLRCTYLWTFNGEERRTKIENKCKCDNGKSNKTEWMNKLDCVAYIPLSYCRRGREVGEDESNESVIASSEPKYVIIIIIESEEYLWMQCCMREENILIWKGWVQYIIIIAADKWNRDIFVSRIQIDLTHGVS